MSSKMFLIIVILVCAASAVLAKPNIMELQIARDQTVCKTKVVLDTNEERIPKTIKMLKCEDDPYVMCPAGDGQSTPCCGARTLAGAKLSCTEVQDHIVVKHAKTMKEDVLTVSIGCSCIKQSPDQAQEQ